MPELLALLVQLDPLGLSDRSVQWEHRDHLVFLDNLDQLVRKVPLAP